MRLLKRVSILGISAFALVAIATSVFTASNSYAHDTNAQLTEQQTTAAEKAEQARQAAKERAAEAKAKAQSRLADAKLRACQNREKAITNILSRLSDRGQKQLNLFTNIADKTKAFYTQKGKTLATYDSLVADVDAKKAAAQTSVDTIKSTSTDFKCDGTDPKGMVAGFKDSLKAQTTALKEYRTAVKNLIVGVKSVQSTNKETKENQ